jgi:hypothetical protein
MPAGLKVLRVVPAGTGNVMARDCVPAGKAPSIWNDMPTWQVPFDVLVLASEQNIIDWMVTPSLTVVTGNPNGSEASLPYDERVRVGTEFADVDIVKTRIAAQAASRFNFFMFPPRTMDRTTPGLCGHVRYQCGLFVPLRMLINSSYRYDIRRVARSLCAKQDAQGPVQCKKLHNKSLFWLQ